MLCSFRDGDWSVGGAVEGGVGVVGDGDGVGLDGDGDWGVGE